MPMQIKSGLKVFRMSDKLVHAEMKNRCTEEKFQRRIRTLEKEQSYVSYTMEKDREATIEELRRMHKVSGFSPEGVPLDGPSDTSFIKSPYFRSLKALSEQQLVKWRYIEKELEKLLAKDATVLIPPWEWDSDQDISKNFAKMMRLLGFNIENDDMLRGIEMERRLRRYRKSIHRVDVFECLREEKDQFSCNFVQSADEPRSAARCSLEQATETFPVSKWGTQLEKEYMLLVSKPGIFKYLQKKKPPKSHHNREALEAWTDTIVNSQKPLQPKENKCDPPNDIPAIHIWSVEQTDHAETADNRMNTPVSRKKPCGSRPKRPVVRPHTATGSRTIVTKNCADKRPKSAKSRCNAGTCNLHEDYKTESVLSDSSDETVLNVSDINELHPPDSVAISCDGDKDDNNFDSANQSGLTPNTDISNDTTPHSTLRHSGLLLKNILDSTSDGLKRFPSRCSKAEIASCHGLIRRIIHSVQQLSAMNYKSCELSGIDIQKLKTKLESLSGVCDTHDVPLRTPKRPATLLATQPADYYRSTSSFADVDALDDVVVSDDSEEVDDDESKFTTPRWKRDLLKEAPAGLFGRASPPRVISVMSRVGRENELHSLIKENITDVKTIHAKEHARRIRARLHLYFTMIKLDEAVERIAQEQS